MMIEFARFPAENGMGETVAGIKIDTEKQLADYYFDGLAELNEQFHNSASGLNECERAYGLILLSVLSRYVTEEKMKHTFHEQYNVTSICWLLAEETVMADSSGKKSLLDVRLQKFVENNPETETAVYYSLLKEIEKTQADVKENMREFISVWADWRYVPGSVRKYLKQVRNDILEQTADTQYKDRICFGVERVIYSGNKTIVLFDDGTKTMATCSEGDTYSRETGLLVCLLKHIYGNEICKFLNDFAEETEKAERNESDFVYLQDSSKPAVKKTEKASTAEVKQL